MINAKPHALERVKLLRSEGLADTKLVEAIRGDMIVAEAYLENALQCLC